MACPTPSRATSSATSLSRSRVVDVAGQALPHLPATPRGGRHRVDAQQGHVAGDEGEDGRLQTGAAGEPAGGHGRPVAQGPQDPGQGDAADAVHRPGPVLGTEDPTGVAVDVVASDDLGGAEVEQPPPLAGLARAGHHLVAPTGQEGDGERADPARGPGDEDRTVTGGEPVVLEAVDREGGGEPGGPDDHGLARREARRQGEGETGRKPRPGGEAAVAGHPQVVPVGQDLGARDQGGVVAGHHHAGQVHPGDEGREAGHPVPRHRDQRVLVVDGRPQDPDQDLPGGQVGQGERHHAPGDTAGLLRRRPRRSRVTGHQVGGEVLGEGLGTRGGDHREVPYGFRDTRSLWHLAVAALSRRDGRRPGLAGRPPGGGRHLLVVREPAPRGGPDGGHAPAPGGRRRGGLPSRGERPLPCPRVRRGCPLRRG